MNTKKLITAAIAMLSLAAATGAQADSAVYRLPTASTSSLTRAEVEADVTAARAAGFMGWGEHAPVTAAVGMAKTRAQVRAEAAETVRLGLVQYGEHLVVPTAAQLQRIEMAGQKALPMTVAAR